MFIGSINRYMRAVLETAAQGWRGMPVYVACSGNFTVERILARCGVGAIHSNDVSIYSCALGWHLANTPKRYVIKAQEYSWLEPYLTTGPATIATLLLAGQMLKVGGDPSTGSGRDNVYARRMREEYRRKWPQLHAKTVERVKKATVGRSIILLCGCKDVTQCHRKLLAERLAEAWVADVVHLTPPPKQDFPGQARLC